MKSSWLGLAALRGLVTALGEGQGSSKGSSHHRLSHIIPGSQNPPKSSATPWKGAGSATPPPSAAFQGSQWQPAVGGYPHHGVEQGHKPQHPTLLSGPCTASSTPAGPGQATVLSHRSKCPSREGFSC